MKTDIKNNAKKKKKSSLVLYGKSTHVDDYYVSIS